MRRGTPSATLFGEILLILRKNTNQSMSALGAKIGSPAATISQIEKGQRALKEEKIRIWANALNVDEVEFKKLWLLSQGYHPEQGYFVTGQEYLRDRILAILKRILSTEGFKISIEKLCIFVQSNSTYESFTITIPKIEKNDPIQRRRTKSIDTKSLEILISDLTGSERNRVRRYVELVIEERTNS